MKLADFYAGNIARRRTGEADYGVWWTDGKPYPRYRVSYIQGTGEVYAVNHNTTEVEVLGIVPPDSEGRYYATLDRIFEGWADGDHELSWVRERLLDYRLSLPPIEQEAFYGEVLIEQIRELWKPKIT